MQPLVENAVKHGIEPKEEGGSITISVDRSEDRILIKVLDTGVGFNLENLKDYDNSQKSSGIGINNVKKRLALKFNGMETFEIESTENIGTIISISLPEQQDV